MANKIETLKVQDIDAALIAGGYTDNRLNDCKFMGYSTRGAARYAIWFQQDGEEQTGYVFVEDVPGVGFVAEF